MRVGAAVGKNVAGLRALVASLTFEPQDGDTPQLKKNFEVISFRIVQFAEMSSEERNSSTCLLNYYGNYWRFNQGAAKLIEMVHFISMRIFKMKFFKISFRSFKYFDQFRLFF